MKRCWQEGRQAEKQANRHRDRHHTFRSTFMLNMVPIPVTAFYIELPHNHWQASATSNLGMKINFYENCKIWKSRWGSGVFDFSLLPPLPQFFFKEFTINIRMFSPPKKIFSTEIRTISMPVSLFGVLAHLCRHRQYPEVKKRFWKIFSDLNNELWF